MSSSEWERVERLLNRVERPARYIDHEWGASREPGFNYRAVLLYPDTYELGMANQAISILYERLNAADEVLAERCFLPWIDMAAAMREEDIPLFGLETGLAVRDADLFGITLPYELTYTNILEALDLAGIPLRARDRGEGDPVVLGGGPCAYNPEPIAEFFDAILIGEGEEAILEIANVHRRARDGGADRVGILRELARLDGVYVPRFYQPVRDAEGALTGVVADTGITPVVNKRVLADLDTFRAPTCPVVPFMDVVHDRASVEILRGCTRGCRFCQAGMVYRPVRERSADSIVRDAIASLKCTGYDEVSLTSLSTTDHSQLEDVLRRLTRRLEGKGISVSVPSLRVDAFSIDMARLVGGGRKSGLTFAPEAGTQRLRDVINKNVTEEELLGTVRHAFDAGWRRVKLYFMLGLPTETDADVLGISDLVRKVSDEARSCVEPSQRGSIRIAVSVSVFVPKAHTPFQWDPQLPRDEIGRRQDLLRSSMPRKGIELSWHEADVSFLEAVMARGGREIADAIEAAWRTGAVFDAWTERFDIGTWLGAFASVGVDPASVAVGEKSSNEILPWDHISCGVSRAYLARERERASEASTTSDCSFDGCTGCDACDELGVEIVLGGGTRGAR